MEFIMGFIVWTAIGLVGGFALNNFYRGPETSLFITLVFGFFGAFIGGMLAMSGYIFHAPTPLRIGGLFGAALGAVGFTFMYHFIARKAI
ncbi:MAG TPA: hypothetical protein VK929_16915 [Longimicrobiales bacterium]|nr:hypothetical protein [Longimicrobiales bacterium]